METKATKTANKNLYRFTYFINTNVKTCVLQSLLETVTDTKSSFYRIRAASACISSGDRDRCNLRQVCHAQL